MVVLGAEPNTLDISFHFTSMIPRNNNMGRFSIRGFIYIFNAPVEEYSDVRIQTSGTAL